MAPKHSKPRVEIAGKLSTDREERSKKVAILKKKRTELVKQTSELQHKQTTDEIEGLEKEIVASPRGYNHIVKLLEYLKVFFPSWRGGEMEELLMKCIAGSQSPEKTTISASATSLCRAFIKLMVKGELSKKKKGATDAEVQILEWLRGQHRTFVAELCQLLDYENGNIQVGSTGPYSIPRHGEPTTWRECPYK